MVDENTWPEDYREGSLSVTALDGIYGDTARLSVYAGHGNVNLLQWGNPSDNGACTTTIDTTVRLGRFDGDVAAAVMLLTSCSLRTDQAWDTFRENAVRQIFGYHNSPYIGYNEARKVFKRTQDGQPTVYAWLDEMEQNGDIGKNSPVALTFGHGAGEAKAVHAQTNLAKGDGFVVNVTEPVDDYYFEWLDNGCTGSCGGCSGNAAPPPEIVPGAMVPMVRLIRPLASSAELVARILHVLLIFGVESLAVADSERLETWADATVLAHDVGYIRIGDIEVSYEPDAARLRIRDRGALDRARPGWDDPDQASAEEWETEQARAEALEVRALLEAASGLGGPLAEEFEVSTRRIGFGGADRPSRSVAHEYLFTTTGRLGGQQVFGHALQIGVTRFGERSSVTISTMQAETMQDQRIKRVPAQALDALRADLEARHPAAIAVELIEPRIGYAMREDQTDEVVASSLVVGYVLAFPSDAPDPLVSRRRYVKISLVSLDSPPEVLEPTDPDSEDGGDARVAR
ncbi:MAG: hypothetical protein HC927_05055 [Deltaproteobacteria bacterium]|nr:hypothetical protein [Deltaproteobacteria bacterium]